MDETLLPDTVDRKAARRERKQRFQAFAKDELDYYEQSKLVLEEEDDTFFDARNCCDNWFFRIRILLCALTFFAMCVIFVVGIYGKDRLGAITKLEIEFHQITNETYCNPTYGWKRDDKINPDCTVRNETTCDTEHFLYFPIGATVENPTTTDCCQCLPSRWGPQCQFQCVGTINITNTTGIYEVPCNNHGNCDSGALGTGQCFCNPFFWNYAGDCEPVVSMIGTVTTIGFFVLLLFFAMVKPYYHYWMFQIFFRCKYCPTILVENELAMGELPQRVSRQLYLSVYGGMFILVLIPQLTQSDSIGTIHGVTNETLDVQRTDLQTASGYLAAFTTFTAMLLTFFSIWDLFANLIKLTSEKGDIAQDLRMQRERLHSEVRQLQEAWTIPIDDIDIGRYLAQGSYGKVSMARWSCLPQIDVVVKEIFPNIMSVNIDPETGEIEETGLFEDAEMQAMLRLRHKHLALFFGAGKMSATNNKFLVFEYCSHGDLFSYIERANQDASLLTQKIVNRLLVELCSAMIFMHSQKFIHRDLKPQNILLQGDSLTVKVCDFGLARIFKEGNQETSDMEDVQSVHRVANRSKTCSFAIDREFGNHQHPSDGNTTTTLSSDLSKSTTTLSKEHERERDREHELSISVSSEEKKNGTHFSSSRVRKGKMKKASLANLVKARDERVNMEDMKMTGRVGTVPYMAPELFMVNVHYCKMVDVFAFGIILWELLAGERVWKEERLVSQIARKIVAGERPSLNNLMNVNQEKWKVELLPLLKKCWADEPVDRMSFQAIELILNSKCCHSL